MATLDGSGSYGTVTNSDRARRVADTLREGGFTEGLDLYGDPRDMRDMAEQAIADLLCDLRHLADRCGVDLADCDRRGGGVYSIEVGEDEAGDWPIREAIVAIVPPGYKPPAVA